MNQPQPPRQRGATIVEALVALLVVALGMVSFAGIQSRMRLNADIARQRSEAVRLAQENMENFRAFGTLVADGSVANNLAYAGVATGATTKTVLASSVSTQTNATYTVTQTVAASAQAGMKEVLVTVAWRDREGADQSVALRSFIAGIDPRLAVTLSIPPNGSPVKDPLGRDLRVPVPAKDLGDGRSAFKPDAAGTLAFVFDNGTGEITSKCTAVGASTTTAQITAASLESSSCVHVNGLVLGGYVRFSTGGVPDAHSPNGAALPLSMRVDLEDDAPPAGSVGTLSQLTAGYWPAASQPVRSDGYTPADCGAQASKVVRYTAAVSYSQVNNGVTQTATSTQKTALVPVAVALTPAGIAPHVTDAQAAISDVADLGDRFVAYTCVVYPRNFGSGVVAWTGRSLVVPAGWTIGTSSSAYKVCRYSEDYNLNGYVWTTAGSNVAKIDNAEHPYAYLMATIGLNNQNFLVISGNRSCPTDGATEVDGTGAENYTNETTVTHQTS